MPFKIMDQRGSTAASRLYEDLHCPSERQVGFWKSSAIHDHFEGKDATWQLLHKKEPASSSLEKPPLANGIEQNEMKSVNEAASSVSPMAPLNSKPWPASSQHLSHSLGNTAADIYGNQWESSLFSSSFSDIFNRKARVSNNDFLSQQSLKVVSHCEEEEPFEASAEIEAKTIGNLLPAEDDLFTGVNYDIGSNGRPNGGDDPEDFDLFSCGGGMELEGEDNAPKGLRNGGPPGFEYGRHSPCFDLKMDGGTYSTAVNYAAAAKCFLEHSDMKQIEINSILPSRQMENGVTPPLHAAIQTSVVDVHRIPNVARQLGLLEPTLPVTQLKNPNHLHPHSLPEFQDKFPNGFLFNSPSSINHIGSKLIGGITSASMRGVAPGGHLMEINEAVSGSPGNGSGGHYMWPKSNAEWQPLPNQMMWPNSPSFVRSANPHHLPHIAGFPRPPVMLPSSPAHHVGSAPTVNPSMWDRRHAYSADLSDTLNTASSSIFPRVPASMIDIAKHGGVGSPQRMGNNFPGRNFMLAVPSSFDSSSERVRSFPHRRVEANPNPCDRKQYELDVDRIMRGEDVRTTLMIKNIPNKYTSKMLLAAIDEHCRGTYDFIYLPIDFKNKCNVGYAFINMIDAQMIIPFHNAFNGKKWEKFNSEKVTNLAYARIQGKAALVAHFQNSSLMNEDKRCRPILFRTEGPNAGDPEPFPVGPNIRLKMGKARSNGNEESNQPGGFSAGDPNGTDGSSSSD